MQVVNLTITSANPHKMLSKFGTQYSGFWVVVINRISGNWDPPSPLKFCVSFKGKAHEAILCGPRSHCSMFACSANIGKQDSFKPWEVWQLNEKENYFKVGSTGIPSHVVTGWVTTKWRMSSLQVLAPRRPLPGGAFPFLLFSFTWSLCK